MSLTAAEVEEQWQVTRELMAKIDRHVFGKLGFRVQNGPFAGMLVTDRPNWDDGNAALKLLGAYEWELWDAIEAAIARKPTAVINVGCAEGYYAIGLKRRLPATPIYALDLNDVSLQQCGEMAERNGVSVETRLGAKTPQELDVGHTHALYIVDCEGKELELLDPALCPVLNSADIIVECHDWDGPKSLPLIQRFTPTHDVELVEPQVPLVQPYQKLLDPLPMGTKLLILTEKRPMPTVWLYLVAKERI